MSVVKKVKRRLKKSLIKRRAQRTETKPVKKEKKPAKAAAATPAIVASTTHDKHAARLEALGIPKKEMTPAVRKALTQQFDAVDKAGRELERTKETLAELERLVDVDCIAPIPNRRAFVRRLGWAIAMNERYGHPSAVLYFDLNNFKQINELYGYGAGDVAIRHVSQLLLEQMRESDFLSRVGSDEFAVIMYYASAEAAHERGRQIADKLSHSMIAHEGRTFTITAAYGVYGVKSGDDAESALSAADMAMGVDKRRTKTLGAPLDA